MRQRSEVHDIIVNECDKMIDGDVITRFEFAERCANRIEELDTKSVKAEREWLGQALRLTHVIDHNRARPDSCRACKFIKALERGDRP